MVVMVVEEEEQIRNSVDMTGISYWNQNRCCVSSTSSVPFRLHGSVPFVSRLEFV